MPTRPEMQNRIKSIRMPRRIHQRIAEYAEANAMSVSEASAELMESYLKSTPPPPEREVPSKRVTMWVDPEHYAQFSKQAREKGVTLAEALVSVLDRRL